MIIATVGITKGEFEMEQDDYVSMRRQRRLRLETKISQVENELIKEIFEEMLALTSMM